MNAAAFILASLLGMVLIYALAEQRDVRRGDLFVLVFCVALVALVEYLT